MDHNALFIADWDGNILLHGQKDESKAKRYARIRNVCLTISTSDDIKPLESITENDLRQTAAIFGGFILTDRKRKFKNRREMTDLIIIGLVSH